MIDVSFNNLHTVQKKALDKIGSKNAFNFQNNQWICDCHLSYFIEWLSKTQSAISSKKDMKCVSPLRFKGNLLRDFDANMMTCSSTNFVTFKISDVTETYFTLSWQQNDSWYKLKENVVITYGPVYCKLNCSNMYEPIVNSRLVGKNFTATNLKSGTSYQVCVQSEMSGRQCVFVTTKAIETKSQTKFNYDNKEKTLTAILIIMTILFACSLVLFYVCVYHHYKKKLNNDDDHSKIFDRQQYFTGVRASYGGTHCGTYYDRRLKSPPGKIPTQNLNLVENTETNQIYAECGPFLDKYTKNTENQAKQVFNNLNRNRDVFMVDATAEFDSFIPTITNTTSSPFLLTSYHNSHNNKSNSTDSRFEADFKN